MSPRRKAWEEQEGGVSKDPKGGLWRLERVEGPLWAESALGRRFWLPRSHPPQAGTQPPIYSPFDPP